MNDTAGGEFLMTISFETGQFLFISLLMVAIYFGRQAAPARLIFAVNIGSPFCAVLDGLKVRKARAGLITMLRVIAQAYHKTQCNGPVAIETCA
jgi:hypothetical protein